MSKNYFGKAPLNYVKNEYVKKIKEDSKAILNNSSTTSNIKKKKLDEIFQKPEFKTFVNDLKLRIAKLNREYIVQKSNNNPKVSPQVASLAETLNAYTNELVGFYENTYYNIPNNSNQKEFIRDLKMIISTYGKLQEDLTNIIYTSNSVENIIKTKGLNVVDSYKSETIKKIENKFLDDLRKKIESQPTPQSIPTEIGSQQKTQVPVPQTVSTQQSEIESNIENNCNNCYRNSVIHLLTTLLRDDDFKGNDINKAFNIDPNDDNCNTKENLKNLLINLVQNKPFHPQSILQTYNPLLIYSLLYKNGNNFVLNQNNKFKIKINNTIIDTLDSLCRFYPNLNTNSISSKEHYFNIFKDNLKKHITISDTNNKNTLDKDVYIDLIINSIYKSYGNSLLYLISEHGLFQSRIFSTNFLNNIKINDNTYVLTSFKNTVLNKNSGLRFENYHNLEDVILNALKKHTFTNNSNKYIILSTGDLAKFTNKNFNYLFKINNNYYEVKDIIYASGGHYISVNLRNNQWYKYDDLNRNDPTLLVQNASQGTVNFDIRGFYPNIFLLKKIGPVTP